MKIVIQAEPKFRYTTYFIGEQGKILSRSVELNPVYRKTGQEMYVRARVESSTGDIAWTQPAYR